MSANASGDRARVSREPFGALPDGRAVERFMLVNARGMSVAVLTYGGIIQRIELPDGANVVLGHDDLDGYTSAAYAAAMPYYGAIIGRYGNRIAGARFELDGRTYELPANNGPNSLHGGELGFHVRVWDAEPVPGGVRLTRSSPDGECGYPGTLDVTVTYTLDADDRVRIDYAATTDAPTGRQPHQPLVLQPRGRRHDLRPRAADRRVPLHAGRRGPDPDRRARRRRRHADGLP